MRRGRQNKQQLARWLTNNEDNFVRGNLTRACTNVIVFVREKRNVANSRRRSQPKKYTFAVPKRNLGRKWRHSGIYLRDAETRLSLGRQLVTDRKTGRKRWDNVTHVYVTLSLHNFRKGLTCKRTWLHGIRRETLIDLACTPPPLSSLSLARSLSFAPIFALSLFLSLPLTHSLTHTNALFSDFAALSRLKIYNRRTHRAIHHGRRTRSKHERPRQRLERIWSRRCRHRPSPKIFRRNHVVVSPAQ